MKSTWGVGERRERGEERRGEERRGGGEGEQGGWTHTSRSSGKIEECMYAYAKEKCVYVT